MMDKGGFVYIRVFNPGYGVVAIWSRCMRYSTCMNMSVLNYYAFRVIEPWFGSSLHGETAFW